MFKLAVTSFAVTVASKLRVAGADTHDMPIYLRTRIRERWPIDHPRLATRNRSAVPVAPPGFDLAQGRLHERVVSVERRHLIEAQEDDGQGVVVPVAPRYALEEPALRAALLGGTDELTQRVVEALARASGLAADELEPQLIASTLIAAMMTAARHWRSHRYRNPIDDELERALAIVERGL